MGKIVIFDRNILGVSANRDREEEIFDTARELASDERAAYLAESCGQDAGLRQRIEEMLQADAAAGEFFKTRDAPSTTVILADATLSPSIEKVGDRIGRYKLLQQIGEGGMGLVYMAEQDQPVRRSVALKIIKLGMDTRQVVARFEAERQALAMMNHPHIAKVFDAGATDSGRPYFVMELVRGIPITEYCDQNCLPTRQRLDLFILVCQAVQHAHQKGIIHRDLKPSNILVTSNDGVPWPMIIDFGIAKATHQRLTEKTVFTHFAQMIGTPAYTSPEQAEMSKMDVDTRTDIYALGVLLYELLTGTTPFSAKELLSLGYREMQRTIVEREPLRLSTRLSTMANEERTVVAKQRSVDATALAKLFRGDLDWIAIKCLEKDRARRYETANALAMDIRRHLENEPVVARPPSRLYEFQKTVRRHKFGFAAAATLILVLALGVLVSTWEAVRATRAEAREAEHRRRAEANEMKAETEATKSAHVAQFLKDMLKTVEPSVALGRDATMLREILDQTAERVGQELPHEPAVQAELLSTIGVTYYGLGEAQKAIAAHQEALRLRRGLFGETNVWVAASLTELGEALEIQQVYATAESAHRQAVALRRLLLGNQHPDTARSLSDLASVLKEQHGLTEAESLQREALAVQTNLFPHGNDDVLNSLHNLGDIVMSQDRLPEAESITRQALELARKLHGAEHPDVATALTRIGRVLERQRKNAEAEPWLRDGYLMRRKFLGNDHAYVSSSLDSYAKMLNGQGKFAEAEAALRDNWKQRATRPPMTLLGAMMTALFGQGKPIEPELRDALARKAADLKKVDDSNEVAWFLATCPEAAFRDGPRAVQLAEQAVAATKRAEPTILDTLAAAYAEVGQFEKAAQLQQEAMALLQDKDLTANYASRLKLYATKKPYHDFSFALNAAGALAATASTFLEQGKAEPAESAARQSLNLRERYAPDDWTTFNSRSLVGGSLLGQKKYAEAEPLLLSGYEGMKQREKSIPAAGKIRIQEAIQRVAEVYEATGQVEKAAEWKKLKEFDPAKAEK